MEKIQLVIGGEYYKISTDDDLEYVSELGRELDGKISDILKGNSRASITQAAVLTALEYADLYKKSEALGENMRNQIQDFMDDAARARADAEVSRREVERLSKEVAALKASK